METKNLTTRYGLPALDWEAIRLDLDAGAIRVADGPGRVTCWLTSVDDDGAPHTNGIGAVWHGGAFWFVTGRQTRRGRNLAGDRRCTLSVSTKEFDLVVAGEAEIVEDRATVEVLAELWRDEGWPCEVDEAWRLPRLTARLQPVARPGTCSGSRRIRRMWFWRESRVEQPPGHSTAERHGWAYNTWSITAMVPR